MGTPLKKKHQFAKVQVGRELQNGAASEPVRVFYTHYRARKFVQEQIAHQTQPRDCQWVIRTVQPG